MMNQLDRKNQSGYFTSIPDDGAGQVRLDALE